MNVTKQTGTANTTYSPGRQIKYLVGSHTEGMGVDHHAAAVMHQLILLLDGTSTNLRMIQKPLLIQAKNQKFCALKAGLPAKKHLQS